MCWSTSTTILVSSVTSLSPAARRWMQRLDQRILGELAVLVVFIGGSAPLDDPCHAVAVAESAPRQPHPAAEVLAGDLSVRPMRSGGLPAIVNHDRTISLLQLPVGGLNTELGVRDLVDEVDTCSGFSDLRRSTSSDKLRTRPSSVSRCRESSTRRAPLATCTASSAAAIHFGSSAALRTFGPGSVGI